MELQERVSYLLELISCSQPLDYWCYDQDAQLLHSTCDEERTMDLVFRSTGCLDYIFETETPMPVILSHESGLIWLAVKEFQQNSLYQIHVLGPFFLSAVNASYIEKLVMAVSKSTPSQQWKDRLIGQLKKLPALPSTQFVQYVVMLHYAVNQEKISASDIVYQSTNMDVTHFSHLKNHTAPKDRLQVYRMERALLNRVREGILDAGGSPRNPGDIAHVRAYVSDPLHSAQIACTIFTSLCVRAAIEGGLSTTLSYSLGDAYIKSYFLAKSISEVGDIRKQMYTDFVNRVHQTRVNPQYSKPIQSCLQYMELHLGEEVTLELLASRLGYTKYYLSRLFKEETGVTVHNYLKFIRLERAKVLLSTTDQRIDQIAESLHFGSRSFFDKAFKKSVGQNPAEYRDLHLSL